jgi:cytoskeletal protein RodZ
MRGISLDELASLTRIPRRSLERLEAGAFDAVPDGFSRGFVRTVAGALGLDPDEAVMRLMREPADPEAAPPGGDRIRRRARLTGVAVLLGAVLLAVGLWKLAEVWRVSRAEVSDPELILRRDPVRALVKEGASEDDQAPGP